MRGVPRGSLALRMLSGRAVERTPLGDTSGYDGDTAVRTLPGPCSL